MYSRPYTSYVVYTVCSIHRVQYISCVVYIVCSIYRVYYLLCVVYLSLCGAAGQGLFILDVTR